jgi:probable HAF family extracellular repeat protein
MRTVALLGVTALILIGATESAGAGGMYTVTEIPLFPSASGTTFNYVSPTGINNVGQVIGTELGNVGSAGGPQVDIEQPFIYSGGHLTKLGPAYGLANGLNDAGQVVGTTYMNGMSASLYSNGKIAPIAGAGAQDQPQAINNSGVVVGSTAALSSVGQAYVQNGSQRTILQSGNFTNGTAIGVNGAGQVAANLTTANGQAQAFLFSGSAAQGLGSGTSAIALNRSGAVVGDFTTTSGTQHAFVWSNGSLHDLGALGGSASGSTANGINSAGVIVGTSNISGAVNPTSHAFVDQNGVMTDLNKMISGGIAKTLYEATGINDLGQILATGVDSEGNRAAFVLTPGCNSKPPTTPVVAEPNVVPEPSVLAFFGLAGLVAWARRSRRA